MAIELSEVVDQLRLDLQVLRNKAQTEEGLQFRLDAVEVELHVAVSQETTGKGAVKFLVFEAGAEVKNLGIATHIVRLKLTPHDVVSAGSKPILLGRT